MKATFGVSNRSADLVDAAAGWLRAEEGSAGALVVAPTRSAASELLYASIEPGGGRLGVIRTTLSMLASELALAPLAAAGRAPVSALGLEALAARAAASRAEELEHYGGVASFPGFARVLASTLEELRAAGVGPPELAGGGEPESAVESAIPSIGESTGKSAGKSAVGGSRRDLARLLTEYERLLEQWSLADRPAVFELARERLESASAYSGLPLLVLDTPLTLTVERRLMTALARGAAATAVYCQTADEPSVEAYREILGVEPSVLEPAGEPPPPGLDRVRRYVFSDRVPQAVATEEVPSVRLIAAPGEGRECVEIARGIRRLAGEGLGFDRMAILLRDPATYLSVIEEALDRAGVPAWFSRGTVRPDPAGRAFLALLAAADERLSAARFAEYLSLGQVPSLPEGGAPPVAEVPFAGPDDPQMSLKFVDDAGEEAEEVPESAGESDAEPVLAGTLRTPANWERLLVDAAVVGGRDRWQRRLAGLEAELAARAEHVAAEDPARRRQLDEQLERLRDLAAFALPLVDVLAALPESAPWGVWIDRLERLAAMALTRPDRVLALLAELKPMRDVGPVGLSEVRKVLTGRLSQLRSTPPENRYGRVFVGTVDEARGRSFDAVFLPGLAEGSFPRRTLEDPLLLDEERTSLSAPLATPLARQSDRIAAERLLLHTAAAAAERTLVISYPSLDALNGRARVPSFYALDVLRAAEGTLPDLDLLEARARDSSASILGWPASRDPGAAIDDAEYDLSVLEPLLRRPVDKSRGGAHYLLKVSPTLGRSLRGRARRWRNFFSSVDGLVDPDSAALEALEGHRLRRRSYSPTALQGYAACPYRFLLQAVHRLRPREAPVRLEQLDPLTRGSLFHEAQLALFRRLEDEGDLLPVTEERLPAVLTVADEVLDEVAERYREQLCPAIPRVWGIEIDNLRADFRGWLRVVAETDGAWRPSHFEFAFGLPESADRDPRSSVEPAAILDGYKVRGAIDLVETAEDGAALRVTDHKTGKARPERALVVGNGEVLQPLVYGLAAEAILGEKVTAGRLFYCTRNGGYKSLEVPLGDYQRLQLSQVLEVVSEAVDEGFLPAAPRPGACQWCDYRPVCGPHEERRVAKKKRERLRSLDRLRKLD